MAEDDEAIFVDILPKLDESETDRVTGRLRDKLKEGAKGAGKAIGDVLHSELAENLGRTIGPVAHDMGVQLGKELGTRAGELLHEQISGALKNVGVDFDGVVEKARELADEFGIDTEKVGNFSDAVKDLKVGDKAKAFDDLTKALSGMPGPLGTVADKSKGLVDTYNSLKGNVKDVSGLLTTFEKDAPGIAGALGTVGAAAESMAGPLAAAAAAAMEIDHALHIDSNTFDPGKHGWGHVLFGKVPDWLGLTDPNTDLDKHNLSTPDAHPPARMVPPSAPNSAMPPPGTVAGPGTKGLLPGQVAPTPKAHTSSAITGPPITGPATHAMLADYTTPSLPNVTSPQDLTAAGGGVANLYRVAESLQGTPYSQKIRNDCSGMVSQLASAALGLPAPGPGERFSTVNEGQWLASHGFQMGTPPPGMANSSLQIGWYDHGGGNLGHTAATLPGGVNAESGGSVGSFSLGGPVGANSPQFEHHAYLPMGMGMPGAPMAGGPGGPRVSPAGFGIGPGTPGIPGLPGLVAPPTMPNMGGGGSPGPVAQQPIGHGSGVGVTGGGALGMAEQAGVMAAAMFGFGGGGMAAQIGMQEMNLAIQKGGQMAATAAMAIPETFMLAGGQMGAPSVGQGGWIRKIVGGMMGQQFNSPNIAGGSQPAKQPKQKEGEGEGEDPLKGGKGGPNGGKPGPSGHADDPIHVQQVNPPAGQPQGQTTSAMNTNAVMSAGAA